ncbi:MAG: pentapeptide repeat-containing protein [Nannocystales bacterium]
MNQPMSDAQPLADQERRELSQLRRLRTRVDAAERARRQRWGWAGGFAARVFVGADLDQSIERWRLARQAGDPVPSPETAQVAAAVIRRVLRVGALTVALALFPTALLIWQNELLGAQNELLGTQNDLIEEQQQALLKSLEEQRKANALVQHQADRQDAQQQASRYTLSVRSLYATRQCLPSEMRGDGGDTICVASSVRERAGAVREIAAIDGIRNTGTHENPSVTSDFSGADLCGADLSRISLHSATFDNAYLGEASFEYATLRFVNLHQAKMRGATLKHLRRSVGLKMAGADLAWANLFGAELFGVEMWKVDLTGALLRGAKLQGASLVGATLDGANLIAADFTGAKLEGASFVGASYCPAGTQLATTFPGLTPAGAIESKCCRRNGCESESVTEWDDRIGEMDPDPRRTGAYCTRTAGVAGKALLPIVP